MKFMKGGYVEVIRETGCNMRDFVGCNNIL